MNSYSFKVELLVILVTVLDAISSPVRPRCSLQCAQAYFGWVKAACLCPYCCNRHLCYDGGRFGRVKVVTLRGGARMKEGKRGGEGEKKIRLPDIIVLLGLSVRWQTEPLIGAVD